MHARACNDHCVESQVTNPISRKGLEMNRTARCVDADQLDYVAKIARATHLVVMHCQSITYYIVYAVSPRIVEVTRVVSEWSYLSSTVVKGRRRCVR